MPARARRTRDAVAEAVSVEAARQAVAPKGRGGAGTGDPLAHELRRGSLLPMLVLHFAAEGPCYGNQLMERIGELTAGTIAVNPNTMYPLLRGLEERGLIVGEWEHPERRSRRFYRVTEEGLAERDRLVAAIQPRLDAVAASVQRIRREIGGGR
jgi:PadR family transcriptional regulator PadR